MSLYGGWIISSKSWQLADSSGFVYTCQSLRLPVHHITDLAYSVIANY